MGCWSEAVFSSAEMYRHMPEWRSVLTVVRVVCFIVAVITANKLVVGPILRDPDLHKHIDVSVTIKRIASSQKNK